MAKKTTHKKKKRELFIMRKSFTICDMFGIFSAGISIGLGIGFLFLL